MKSLLLYFFIFFPAVSLAENVSLSLWKPGIHLFAGGGVNSSLYTSETEHVEGGIGVNLKTDLVYFLNDRWAADAGSAVKFNRIDGFLLWDTQFTLGFRRRLRSTEKFSDPYVRLYVGKSPTVIFLDGNGLAGKANGEDINRIQYDGNVFGFTLGNSATTKNGTIWFSELGFTLQRFERESDIKMEGEVPVVTQERPAEENSSLYSITITIGALIF